MLCILSEFTFYIGRARVLPAVALFLNLALLVSCPALKAQTVVAERPEGSISGRVYEQDSDHPATQVAVSIKSHEVGIFRSVLTDYDGRFEVSGLVPGAYEIRVEEQGYEPLHASALLEGPSAKVELHLTKSVSLHAPPSKYTVSVRELSIPGKAREEFNKGLQNLVKKDFAGSLSHFAKAIKVFPGYFEAVYHQGVAETGLGQWEKAMQTFQRSSDLSGGQYAWADFGMGYLLYLQGKDAEAETIVRRGLDIEGNSADGYVVLGMTLLRLNRPDEAEKSAREALLRNPNMANAYLVLADSFARRHDYREQIQGLDSFLKLQPTGPISKRAAAARELAEKFLSRNQPKD